MTTDTAVSDVGLPELPAIAPDVREANRAASQANAATALYGLSGSGKSNIADTAAEYAWEEFRATTLCYAADLGGWGNKRLALIRAGIVRVWDPRNHQNAFATMEMISLGAWPAVMLDAERGHAAPDVPLILPRVLRYVPYCPNGHAVGTFASEADAARVDVVCATCQARVTAATAARVQRQIVKPGIFKGVGLRIYDSMTALNEWGLMQELPRMSAEGELPKTGSGGSLLGAADAVRSGDFRFGSGSQAQVGFMQNRTYVWLANIRAIPDQVVPSVITFGVEASKADDESGGQMILGPKIAGNARTSAVPGWVGNCLHTSKEPQSDAPNAPLVYRVWLTNHIDPKDPRKIPYLAKHRGLPLDMPDFLEDPPGDPERAWSQCNLGYFFRLLQAQLEKIEARNKARFKTLPDVTAVAEDEVVGEVTPSAAAPQRVTGAIARAGAAVAKPVARVVAPAAPAAPAAAGAAPSTPAATPPPTPPAATTAVPVATTAATTPAPAPATTPATTPAAAPAASPPRIARPVARTAVSRPPVG